MNVVVPLGWLGSSVHRALPVVGSGIVHGALFASVALGSVPSHALAGREERILSIETVDDEPPLPTPEPARDTATDAPTARSAAPSQATHTHAYPVPASHDATPHDPATDHRPASSSEQRAEPAPVVTAAAAAEPPRFSIDVGPGPVGRPGVTSGIAVAGAVPSVLETVPEAAVSVPARLIASAAASYPAEARASEAEADVLLEIVVDTTGAVVQARSLSRAGFGLDEAALSAIRKYRFSPAQRDGRLVRVRMRWSVQFRLR